MATQLTTAPTAPGLGGVAGTGTPTQIWTRGQRSHKSRTRRPLWARRSVGQWVPGCRARQRRGRPWGVWRRRMARQLGVGTLQQDFWKEAYLKELMIRCCWHQRYGAALKARQEQLRQRRPAAKEPLKLPAIQLPAPEAPKPPPEPAGPVDMLEGTMKPVAAEVQQLLYQGVSHDGEGRRCYLRQRQAWPPEDKYYSPITTNFIYGWQMGNISIYVPPAPKCRIESFFRKNGAFSLLDPRDVAM